jgi:hypothetical protein
MKEFRRDQSWKDGIRNCCFNTRAYTLGFSLYPTRPDTDILSQTKLELNAGGNKRRLIVVEVVKRIRPDELSLCSGIIDLRLQ